MCTDMHMLILKELQHLLKATLPFHISLYLYFYCVFTYAHVYMHVGLQEHMKISQESFRVSVLVFYLAETVPLFVPLSCAPQAGYPETFLSTVITDVPHQL